MPRMVENLGEVNIRNKCNKTGRGGKGFSTDIDLEDQTDYIPTNKTKFHCYPRRHLKGNSLTC